MGRLGCKSCMCHVPAWIRYIRPPSLVPQPLIPSLQALHRFGRQQQQQPVTHVQTVLPPRMFEYAAKNRPPRPAGSAPGDPDSEGEVADEAFLFGNDLLSDGGAVV